jgi:hTAFII28-like protein conserved region
LTLRILLETFTPEQMQRYEVFRRANLNKGGVKKVFPQSPLFPLSKEYFDLFILVIQSNSITIDSAEYSHCDFWICKSVCRRDCRERERGTDAAV